MAIALTDYLEASAAIRPDAVAVLDGHGGRLTYRELDALANAIAALLLQHGVAPGDRVGLVTPKSVKAVAALFGIMKVRAAYVPVDCTAPPARNATILADCQVKAILLHNDAIELLAAWPEGVQLPAVVIALDGEDVPAGIRTAPVVSWSDVEQTGSVSLPEGRSPDDLAYILYTSGSTGIPKGVMLTNRNATSFVDWCSSIFAPVADDRFASHAPFHFDLSVLDIYVSIKHGASLYLVSEEIGKNPRALGAFISEHRLTVWYSTPSILTLLAQLGDLDRKDFSSLRLVLFAGEVFPIKHLRHIVSLWPRRPYYNLYGPTETNVCTYFPIPATIPENRTDPYPIGFRCEHCAALVLSSDGQEVPPGDEGLLFISGPSVFAGYWNRPKENATCLLERNGQTWYNTGDVVREDAADGYVYLGRRDRMVKRRGYRIELGEIERALYLHPSLVEVAALGVTDPSGLKIAAYVVSRGQPRPTIVELKAFCAQNLPAYMSPDIFIFVDVLPRTSTNKVDYQRLAQGVGSM